MLTKDFIKVDQTNGIVAANRHWYRLKLRGYLENRDVWV